MFRRTMPTQPLIQPVGDDNAGDLDYLLDQAFSPQWKPFMLAMSAELFGNFSVEEAQGFFRQIGARVATEQPLPRLATLQELERAINDALARMSWGYVLLSLHENDIIITHRAYPGSRIVLPSGDAWRRGFSAVLAGVYTVWLQTQGGRSDMRAHEQEGTLSDALVFRFGY